MTFQRLTVRSLEGRRTETSLRLENLDSLLSPVKLRQLLCHSDHGFRRRVRAPTSLVNQKTRLLTGATLVQVALAGVGTIG